MSNDNIQNIPGNPGNGQYSPRRVQQMPPAPEAPVQTGPAMPTPQPQPPARQIKTNRTVLKYILLGIITLGIYDIVVMTGISTSINTIASKHDGKKTMHFCLLAFVFSWLTLGIAVYVWYHRLSNRIGDELQRRGHNRMVTATDYWIWDFVFSAIGMAIMMFLAKFIGEIAVVIGLVIALVGECIYFNKLLSGMNELAADYNARG